MAQHGWFQALPGDIDAMNEKRTASWLGDFAALTPDKPAVINATNGSMLSYRELDERSARLARYLHEQGLRRGDHVAMLLENSVHCFEFAWAALRSGLVFTAVNRYMTPAEAAYVIQDCDAKVLLSSHAMQATAAPLAGLLPAHVQRLMAGAPLAGWQDYEAALAGVSPEPLAEQWLGNTMLYSSGTTGRPKGVLRTITGSLVSDGPSAASQVMMQRYGFGTDMVYLSPAPLYHAAPLGYSINTQFSGGTVVFMEKFDALAALELVERHRITHSQWVPTMFIRLLKLDEADRRRFDLSSLRVAIHAAAPCPVEVKRRMIEWWGPIIHEYYGGTEGNGLTAIGPDEALERPGSVGRAVVGKLHICDEEGSELPVGKDGIVYFERDELPFHYHKDPERTDAARHPVHPNWTALGDIGHVDADGYLYLTDRRSFMIISGGVNIYPQAIEDALVLHPLVADAAVIGVPDAEMGEAVKAVIEPEQGVAADAALAAEFVEFLRGKVARYMVPRSVDFIDRMPRLPTGKLYKKALRERYAQGAASGS